jgi:hypothetical protein
MIQQPHTFALALSLFFQVAADQDVRPLCNSLPRSGYHCRSFHNCLASTGWVLIGSPLMVE